LLALQPTKRSLPDGGTEAGMSRTEEKLDQQAAAKPEHQARAKTNESTGRKRTEAALAGIKNQNQD
jgi:hypothetical protein